MHNKFYRNSKFLKVCDRIFEYIQRVSRVNRLKNKNLKIIDGWTWFSITDKFCDYILRNEKFVYKYFKNTIASDEIFIHTLAYNSEFKEQLFDINDLKNGSMRYIDWGRGHPYVWGNDEADLQTLLKSPYIFARKFDENHYDIVEKIFKEVKKQNEFNE